MADNNGIKFLQYYSQKLKSFFLSKDILSFLLFLVLSSAFWFVHALGKERETHITVPIRYTGMPLNIAVTNSPPTEISLNIKDQGIRLLDYANKQMAPLVIDVNKVFARKGVFLITSDQLNSTIRGYLKPTTTVLAVRPDSIYIRYEKLCTKTLPINFSSKIGLAHQYMLSDRIVLEPNKVTVFGPKKTLDSLKYISTEFLEQKNLNDTAYFQVKLKPIKHVHFSVKKTKVSVFVEPFTERKVQISIVTLNCPDNLSIRTFPAFVNATYTVGLSRFNILSPSDIQVYLDYNELKLSKQTKQALKIKNNTSHISNIRIVPQEVEFILEQK